MNRQDIINHLHEELKSMAHDIRCEAVLNQSMHNGLRKEDAVVLNDGRFYREYRNDIYNIDKIEDDWRHPYLQLHLSRSGIYDLLPEGLFHQPVLDLKPLTTAAEMAEASKIDKKKESATRKFFQPLEHHFFMQRMAVETAEDRFLQGIENGLLNDYFFSFWGFPKTLHNDAALLLMLLLPYAHVIAGDLKLMEQCLSLVLNEAVSINETEPELSYAPAMNDGIGSFQLGVDTACGEAFFEDYTHLRYIIGPLRNSHPSSYIGGGNEVLLNVFTDFFAPVDADVTIQVEVDAANAVIKLDEEREPILGYSTIL